MYTNLPKCQYDVFVQPAGNSLKQLLCYKDVSFDHSLLANCEGLSCLINEVVQSNWVVM